MDETPDNPPAVAPSRKVSRRKWLRAGAGTLGAMAVTGLYTWQVEPHWVAVEEVALPFAGLDERWRGRLIVQISDIHVGTQVDSDYLIDSLRRINDMKPDLVVVTGDFMSCWDGPPIAEVSRVFSHLNAPPLGCLAAFGNHDYGWGWARPDIADRLRASLRDVGVEFLVNQVKQIDGLTIAGIDDYWSQRYDAKSVIAQLDSTRATLALCHNPDAVDRPEWQDFHGWILAGHTHGGQCKPPFLPPPLLPVQNRRYTSGPFELDAGKRWMYINRGLGHLRKVRFNCRPEITRITLV